MASTTVKLRARYEGANVGGWVGFRELMGLAEEAVLEWFRARGLGPAMLSQTHGVGFSVVDSSVLVSGGVRVDDDLVAVAAPVGQRYFDVRLSVVDGETSRLVLRGRLTVVLVRERDGGVALPEELAGLLVPEIAGLGTAVPSHDRGFEERALAEAAARGFDVPVRSRRIPTSAGHHAGRMQHAAYVRALDDAIDALLADRGVDPGRLLPDRGWIPFVARARVRLLADATVGETLHAVYTITDVVRNGMLDGRFDCHVRRGDRLVPTATGIILHGFVYADGQHAGQPVTLDGSTIAALVGSAAGAVA